MLDIVKAAAAAAEGHTEAVLLGLVTILSLESRLAIARLHNKLSAEQEARCRHCEAVRFPAIVARPMAADAVQALGRKRKHA